MKRILHIFIIFLFLSGLCNARIITVDDDGPADFNNIQAAIDDANNGDTIIVADGTYTGQGNRDIRFNIWKAAITVRSENGPTNCIIDCQGNPDDWHRAFIFYSAEGPVVQGFTITGGWYDWGGGMYCQETSPTIINCIFYGNWALEGGGVGLCDARLAKVINCTFYNNYAVKGGGVGGSGCFQGHPTVQNCIFWGNEPEDDPGVAGGGGSKCGYMSIRVNFSILQNNWQSEDWLIVSNSIIADPCFADANNNDFHLKSQAGRWDPNVQSWVKDDVTSVAIDAGDPASPIGLEPFPNGGVINMGAYGGTAETGKSYFGEPVCETVVAGDINGDCKVDFRDFALMAFHWLEEK